MGRSIKRLVGSLLLLAVAGHGAAWGAAAKDLCQGDVKQLRAAEAEQCSGLNYLVNPSACFNTRKALAPFNAGKCGQPAVPPPAQATPGAAVTAPAAAPPVALAAAPIPVEVRPANPAPAPTETDRLRQELVELKAELQRLKEEISALKSRQR